MPLSGIKREAKIEASNVRNVFTPNTPIHVLKLFHGRTKTVSKLLENLNTPGQHAMLYGDRGVGKSSLANIITQLLIQKFMDYQLYKKKCCAQDNYQTIFEGLIEKINKIRKIDVNSEGDLRVNILETKNNNLIPSFVAELLEKEEGVFYIDEADRLINKQDKIDLADTIKHLSDMDSPFKILLVGIAKTGDELRAGHPSVQRCLKETKLERMKHKEIREIIESGSKEIGYEFYDDVIESIVNLSSGYAHFTHLISLKCVEKAIDKDVKTIDRYILHTAIIDAMEEAQGTLRNSYDAAVRSANTDMFKIVLLAAAKLGNEYEFNINSWREEIENYTGNEITVQKLTSYQRRLVANDESAIIQRIAKGVYKFNDPRMPSFIRLCNFQEEKTTKHYKGFQPRVFQ